MWESRGGRGGIVGLLGPLVAEQLMEAKTARHSQWSIRGGKTTGGVGGLGQQYRCPGTGVWCKSP